MAGTSYYDVVRHARSIAARASLLEHDNQKLFLQPYFYQKTRRDKNLGQLDGCIRHSPFEPLFGQPAEPRRSDPSRTVWITLASSPRHNPSSAFESTPSACCSGPFSNWPSSMRPLPEGSTKIDSRGPSGLLSRRVKKLA